MFASSQLELFSCKGGPHQGPRLQGTPKNIVLLWPKAKIQAQGVYTRAQIQDMEKKNLKK